MKILRNVLASEYTTMKIGGIIDTLFLPESIEELKEIITDDFVIIGNGSNILISDEGIQVPVIKISDALSRVSIVDNILTAEAGISLRCLCQIAANAGLSGLEFVHDIPGTLGGAIYMNAGAWDGVMHQIVLQVKAIDRSGKEYIIKHCNFSHRQSIFHSNNLIIVEAKLCLIPRSTQAIRKKIIALAQKRKSTQPTGYPNAGSIFKTKKAAKYIRHAAAAGYKIGGAEVSTKNPTFIMNTNNASFQDISSLIRAIQNKVQAKCNGKIIELEVEKFGQRSRKAAIITLLGYHNYGQRLQNYATTKILENLGYQVETLCFKQPKPFNPYLMQFTQKYMKVRYISNLAGIENEFDLVVVGSDQIFNPNFLKKPLKRKVNLFSLAEKVNSKNLISFSASFGLNEIPKNMTAGFMQHLARYNRLSVREQQGAELIKKLINRQAAVFLDPVMLLDTIEWENMASNISGSYIFNFFVDKKEAAARYQKEISTFAAAHELDVKEMFKMPVEDFLGCIKNAQLVVTNSFHGVCFSILFKKPFVLLDNRKHMASRFDTLFEKFNIEGRKITDINQLSSSLLQMQYPDISSILLEERKKAEQFLKAGIRPWC